MDCRESREAREAPMEPSSEQMIKTQGHLFLSGRVKLWGRTKWDKVSVCLLDNLLIRGLLTCLTM